MATHAEFIEYVREQARGAGAVSFRRMFGEYACYLGDKVVALVCDDQFYLKPTEAGRRLLGAPVLAPPYPGAKLYFRLDAALEDPDELTRLLRATAAELPLPKAKPKAKVAAKAKSKTKAKPKTKGKPSAKRKPKAEPKSGVRLRKLSTSRA